MFQFHLPAVVKDFAVRMYPNEKVVRCDVLKSRLSSVGEVEVGRPDEVEYVSIAN